MSGKKNTDCNVISSGKWGPELSTFVIWHRGSSQSPDGRFGRVSILTWQHGGFADQWPDPDEFVKQLKADSNQQQQFDAAYKSRGKFKQWLPSALQRSCWGLRPRSGKQRALAPAVTSTRGIAIMTKKWPQLFPASKECCCRDVLDLSERGVGEAAPRRGPLLSGAGFWTRQSWQCAWGTRGAGPCIC